MIRFNFDKEKFFALMQIMCEKVPDLDILKAVKLLYFIDREFLLQYGRPILGDAYICMNLGPVPSKAYDYLKDIQNGLDVNSPLHVDKFSKSPGEHPIFKTKTSAELDIFAEVEVSCINDVLQKCGNLAPPTLVDISHKHKAWDDSERNTPIDYKLFFADEPEKHKDAYEAMILEQEDRDFVDDI